MANRGRPRKAPMDSEIEDAEIEQEIVNEETKSDSDVVGEGTFSDYNPFAENVVERDYATPKTASGVVEEIDEPSFVPPSYEDIIQEREQVQENLEAEQNPNPFLNPNPAINELDDREKRIACESLVDTCLDAYEQLHKYAQFFIKVDEEELLQKQSEGKIDLSMEIPVAENGQTMSVAEFIAQYNEQGANALKYDKEFGYKVRPAMIRVFVKRGWGMTDEQFLLYMFGKDLAVKFGIIYSLRKTMSSTMKTLEAITKRSNSSAMSYEEYEEPTPPPSPRPTMRQEVVEEMDEMDEVPEYVAEEPIVMENFTEGMNINMPQNPKDPMAGHPKEVRNILRKSKRDENKE